MAKQLRHVRYLSSAFCQFLEMWGRLKVCFHMVLLTKEGQHPI